MSYVNRLPRPSCRVALLILLPLGLLPGFATCDSPGGAGDAGTGPLGGPLVHDFGVVDFTGSDMIVEHAFTLRNVSDDRLEIDHLNSTCGCVTPTASTSAVAPGDDLRIHAAMKLDRPGRKREHITIIFADDRAPVRLELRADARLVRSLAATEHEIIASPVAPGTLRLHAVATTPDWPPPDPWWDEIDGMAIEFGGWQRVEDNDADSWLWEGTLRLTLDGAPITDRIDAMLRIRVGTHQELRVPIRIVP